MKGFRNIVALLPAALMAGCLPDFPKADFDEQAIITRALMDTRKYIFVTPNAHNGNFKGTTFANGIAGADDFCMQQYTSITPALPTGIYKALMVDNVNRVACTSVDCGTAGAAEHKDWVLSPNESYYLPTGTRVLATNANGIVPVTATNTGLDQAFDTNALRWWTGMDGDWLWLSTTNDCNAWSGGTLGMTGEGGALGETAISIAPCTCSATTCATKSMRILCVRQ